MKQISVIAAAALSAVSGAVAWYVTDRYWKERNRKEVEAVREGLREHYEQKKQDARNPVPEPAEEDHAVDIPPAPVKKKTYDPDPDVYILKPEEYGEREGYEQISYLYFPDADKYVNAAYQATVDEEEVNTILEGVNAADHFGEFEDDAVYVRNERLKMDIAVYLHDEEYNYE